MNTTKQHEQEMKSATITRGVAKTDGKGWWSTTAKAVPILLEVSHGEIVDYPHALVGHLHAAFAKKDWNTRKLGLIYTDATFLEGVQTLLREAGFAHYADLRYSEQGMQGYDYVDFNVGDQLARELVRRGHATLVEE